MHLNFYIYGKVKCSSSNFTFTQIDEFEKLVLSYLFQDWKVFKV